MDRYIGLDAHASSCTVAVLGPSGRKLQCQVLETNAKALINFLITIPKNRRLIFEEGTHSNWLHEVLSPHVQETVVVAVRQSRGPKDDERDAFGLAEDLRIGNVKVKVYKKQGEFATVPYVYSIAVDSQQLSTIADISHYAKTRPHFPTLNVEITPIHGLGNHRLAPSTGRAPTQHQATALESFRSRIVDRAPPCPAKLATPTYYRPARYRCWMAPGRLEIVLEMAVPVSSRAAKSFGRDSRSHTKDVL